MCWQYLLSGGLALYILETIGSNHSDMAVAGVAILVCFIPDFVHALLSLVGHDHKTAKRLLQLHKPDLNN